MVCSFSSLRCGLGYWPFFVDFGSIVCFPRSHGLRIRRKRNSHLPSCSKFATYSSVLNRLQGFLFFSFSFFSCIDSISCSLLVDQLRFVLDNELNAVPCQQRQGSVLLLALTLLTHLPCAHRIRPARACLLLTLVLDTHFAQVRKQAWTE